VRDGTLYGTLTIRGVGDPKLVLERMWLLLRRVQGLGVRSIHGDIVLDHSAFAMPEADPGGFDGEPLRPYNVAPDALLLNYKSVVMTFVPDRTANTAQVQVDPPLAGVAVPATVPLSGGECGDYRGAAARGFFRPDADPLCRHLPGQLPGEDLADRLCRPAQLFGARGRRPVAGHGRANSSARCATANSPRRRHHAGAGVRAGLAQSGRSDPRHQQVQQQRDGAAGVPDAGADAARQQWWRTCRFDGGRARRDTALVAGAYRRRSSRR
jgi:hypothetical protein